jgi:fucose permease
MLSSSHISYRPTIYACYIGFVIQASVVNLTPVLFIPLRELYGLSYEQLGSLVLINFVTQVSCDLGFSNLVDKYGFRRFIVAAQALCVVGFSLFAAAPLLTDKPYPLFILATIIFSGAGGLLELLLSPIVNAIPGDEKASAMSVLHSFYAWGQMAVIILTTLYIFGFGRAAWPGIVLLWTLPPIFNFFLFLRVPLAPPVPEEHRLGMRQLIGQPFFLTAIGAILLGGAAENSISQWTSAFMERGLGLPKLAGDVAGMSAFALMLGVGRALHGAHGKRVDLNLVMMAGALLAVACYLVVALSPWNLLSLVACALCGLAVSLLWPGTLVIAAEKYPLAGAWMFAILAAGGDIGASIGPWIMGMIAEHAPRLDALTALGENLGLVPEQLGLRLGMLAGAILPLGAFLCLRWLHRARITALR